jgi:hypothetical protein
MGLAYERINTMIHKMLPFTPPPHTLTFEAESSVVGEIHNPSLMVSYRLNGNLNKIELIDPSLGLPKRTHELWKNTCFEWFLKSDKSLKYWEFNASPTGLWNFYELDSYRTNLKESFLISEPLFHSELKQEKNGPTSTYCFSMKCSLKALFNESSLSPQSTRLAITTVIHWKTNETTYYSLKHPQEKPDFHSPDGFVIPFTGNC